MTDMKVAALALAACCLLPGCGPEVTDPDWMLGVWHERLSTCEGASCVASSVDHFELLESGDILYDTDRACEVESEEPVRLEWEERDENTVRVFPTGDEPQFDWGTQVSVHIDLKRKSDCDAQSESFGGKQHRWRRGGVMLQMATPQDCHGQMMAQDQNDPCTDYLPDDPLH